MGWRRYAESLLLFSGIGLAFLYLLLRVQGVLPLNPQEIPANAPDLAFNTAASFTSNTNWQSYSGETTLSYLSQMLGLTVQNFVSAASGMAVLVALIRSLAAPVGNYYWELLGRSSPHDTLHPIASIGRADHWLGGTRRHSEFQAVSEG